MKKLKRIISPLAKKQLKELKDFNQILYGTSRANQIYFSIKDCLQVLTDFPGLGYIEPTLQDYPQCFRTFSAFEFKNRLLDRRWCYKNSHVLWNSSETGKVTLYNRTYFRLGL